MIVYRLCKSAHIALDGEGARLWGGRWNSPGLPMVYTAASPSLAVLEILVHLDLPAELLPDDFMLLTIKIPDDAPIERCEQEEDMRNDPAAEGDAFLRKGSALAMMVQSVVVPQEWNILLNPRHPVMAKITVQSVTPFRLDPRLLA